MLPSISNNSVASSNPFQAAYDATAADREVVSTSDLLTVNVDVPAAVTTVLGVVSRLGALRAEISAKLPSADVDAIDKTEVYAQALSHAHTLYLAASPPGELLPELAEQALKYRDLLLADAKALAMHGLFDAKPLAELKGGPGYLNIATDLSVLTQMFRERWSNVAQKTALDANDIAEASKLFAQITRAVGDRTQQPPEVAHASDVRQRAFTLFVKAYDQVRKMMSYVRWETGDADKLAPSLWANRGGKSNGSNKTESPAANASPAEAKTPAAPSTVPPPTPAAPVGHPNSSPFADN
jgi:hypothetical protein